MNTALVALLAGIVGCLLAQPISASSTVTYKENVLHTFQGGIDGANPGAVLIDVNGTLYGTTGAGGGTGCGGQGCGTVYSVDPKSGAETVLYSFCSQENCADGAAPDAALIVINGLLFGTTYFGGLTACGESYGCGTVFSIDPGSDNEKVVYSFCSQQDCTDGEMPAGLLNVKGTLYGTTLAGGSNCEGDGDGCGTVFSLDPNTGAETVLYSFCPDNNLCTDGEFPNGLINVKGTLYGTTQFGGVESSSCPSLACGTVFALDPKTGVETVVHSFCYGQSNNCTDSSYPTAAPISVNGTLYGTTIFGGTNCAGYGGCGTVFSLDLSTGTEAVPYSFCRKQQCQDGQSPEGGLIDMRGTLYGTTPVGGKGLCCGTVFSLNPDTGVEAVLHSFCAKANCADGTNPYAALIAVNGNLYGTTPSGGETGCGGAGCGTVFVLKKKR